MKKLINFLFAFAASAAATMPCWADWAEGERMQHMVSVCLDKEDANEVVDAHADKGVDAAQALWETKGRCRTLPVVGALVGKVVHRRSVKVEGESRTASVVEILAPDHSIAGYFITTQRVNEKPDSNT